MTSRVVKTVIFTIRVPGTVAVVIPRAIADDAVRPTLFSSIGFLPVAMGAAVYF
ncbi:MAG: hypothetical protein LAP39_07675 [Acidobacteriia bacterium]|nr:hypothetical protein [Terriglobia bacterium]